MSVDKNKGLARLVRERFPAHFTDYESRLIDFIQEYYNWDNLEGNTQYDIANLIEYLTVTGAPEEFREILLEEIMPGLPKDTAADRILLAQHIIEFYKTKGSEKSIKFLFRILYDEEIEILYPRDNILRPSDSVWQKKIFLKIKDFGPNVTDMLSRRLFGVESGSQAVVESIKFYSSSLYDIAELDVSSVIGDFKPDEIIQTRDSLDQIAARVVGIVGSFSISEAGTGYSVGEDIPVTGGDGLGFQATVGNVNANGGITDIIILDTGYDFNADAPVPDIPAMAGSGAEFDFSLSGVYRSPGQYYDYRSQPSGTSKLQDGKYYQEYSYVIRTQNDASLWKELVVRNVHPAGLGLFSELNINNSDLEVQDLADLEIVDRYISRYDLDDERLMEDYTVRLVEDGEERRLELPAGLRFLEPIYTDNLNTEDDFNRITESGAFVVQDQEGMDRDKKVGYARYQEDFKHTRRTLEDN